MDEVLATIARMEEQIHGLDVRMGNLEKLTDSVHNLSVSLERMTAKQEAMECKVADIASDVDDIREKPAKYWGAVVTGLISAIIGAVVAFVVKK